MYCLFFSHQKYTDTSTTKINKHWRKLIINWTPPTRNSQGGYSRCSQYLVDWNQVNKKYFKIKITSIWNIFIPRPMFLLKNLQDLWVRVPTAGSMTLRTTTGCWHHIGYIIALACWLIQTCCLPLSNECQLPDIVDRPMSKLLISPTRWYSEI